MLLYTIHTFTDRTAERKPFFRVFRRDICSINCASVCMLVEALNVYLIKHRPIEGAHCCAAGVVRALFGVRFAGVVLLNRTHTHTFWWQNKLSDHRGSHCFCKTVCRCQFDSFGWGYFAVQCDNASIVFSSLSNQLNWANSGGNWWWWWLRWISGFFFLQPDNHLFDQAAKC